MPQINLTSLFESVASSETPWIFPHLCSGDVNSTRMRVTEENTTENERKVYGYFLNEIGVSPEEINFGVASYKGGVFSGHSPVFFGIQDDVMGLLIGSNTSSGDSESLFVPCEAVLEKRKQGRKEIEKYVYYLNQAEVQIEEIIGNDGKQTNKYILKIETQSSDGITYTFRFPFLIDKKREFGVGEFEILFNQGKLKEALREFSTGGDRIYLSANKAFTDLFINKSFPKEGVRLLVKNGTLNFKAKDSHERIKQDIYSSTWEILDVSHPYMDVTHIVKKEKMTCALGDATHIQFTSAAKNNEGYTCLTSRVHYDGGVYPDLGLIWIKWQASTDVTHSPVNTCALLPNYMLFNASKYPEMVKYIKEYYQQPAQLTPASNVTVDVTTKEVNADDLYQPAPASIYPPESPKSKSKHAELEDRDNNSEHNEEINKSEEYESETDSHPCPSDEQTTFPSFSGSAIDDF